MAGGCHSSKPRVVDCNDKATEKLVHTLERLTLRMDNLQTKVRDLRARSHGTECGGHAPPLLGLVSRAWGNAESNSVPATVTAAGSDADPLQGTPEETGHHSTGPRVDTAAGTGLHESGGPRTTPPASHRITWMVRTRGSHVSQVNVSLGGGVRFLSPTGRHPCLHMARGRETSSSCPRVTMTTLQWGLPALRRTQVWWVSLSSQPMLKAWLGVLM